MFFGRSWKLSGVVFLLGINGLSGLNNVKAQSTDRAPVDPQFSAERKNLSDISVDGPTKNRISNVNEEANQPPVAITRGSIPSEASVTKPAFVPAALPFLRNDKLSQLEKAYLDAFTILNNDNSCSRFYGGPPAIIALNELVKQLKPTYMSRGTGLRMSGPTTTVQHNPTGFKFRLFEKAELNLAGPFYRGNMIYELHVSSIGGFQPNTREARVTLLLHELGHLVKGPNKQWVLPDDGDDAEISRGNTTRVVSTCRKQIDALNKMSLATELMKAGVENRTFENPPAEASPF